VVEAVELTQRRRNVDRLELATRRPHLDPRHRTKSSGSAGDAADHGCRRGQLVDRRAGIGAGYWSRRLRRAKVGGNVFDVPPVAPHHRQVTCSTLLEHVFLHGGSPAML
jgi:hypothetical protein